MMLAIKLAQRCVFNSRKDLALFRMAVPIQTRFTGTLSVSPVQPDRCFKKHSLLKRKGFPAVINSNDTRSQMTPTSCFRCIHSVTGKNRPQDNKMEILLHTDGSAVTIVWDDGRESSFHSIWLRNCCHCESCKQEHSGQILIDVGAISPDIKISHVHEAGTGTLCITWQDSHKGVIPLDYLRQHEYSQIDNRQKTRRIYSQTNKVPEIEFKDMVSSKAGGLKWMREINEHGLCLLRNVPLEDDMVLKVAEHIAPVQKSIYGEVFDVCTVPNPINVAYSSVGLDFHMDLIYFESAPGLQLLHCIKFDECVSGGESIFLDSFHVAEVFREEHPKDFEILSKIPATFQKIHYAREFPVHMTYQKPHIFLNHKDEIIAVNWAPAFEGPLAVRPEDVEPYYKAYHKFAAAIKNSPAIIQFKMKEGDLITFNNRRMLHGRKSFQSNGGTRFLKGCYINIDDFKNKLSVLSHILGDDRPIKRVGNQCWF